MLSAESGRAVGFHGALPAARPAARADRGAEVHNGLGIGRKVPRGGVLFGVVPQAVFNGPVTGPAGNGMITREHPLHIAVQDRIAPAAGQRQDRARGGTADARQGDEIGERPRELALEFRHNPPGRLVQITRPGVVTEPAPMRQNGVWLGRRERPDIREAAHESPVVRDHRAHLRLLQHDLRDPDPIGRLFSLPGQVVAAVALEPGQ